MYIERIFHSGSLSEYSYDFANGSIFNILSEFLLIYSKIFNSKDLEKIFSEIEKKKY